MKECVARHRQLLVAVAPADRLAHDNLAVAGDEQHRPLKVVFRDSFFKERDPFAQHRGGHADRRRLARGQHRLGGDWTDAESRCNGNVEQACAHGRVPGRMVHLALL